MALGKSAPSRTASDPSPSSAATRSCSIFLDDQPRSRARCSTGSPSTPTIHPWPGTAAAPQPRARSPAHHPHTGTGAEGGGGWPMHATAQPWHAEGRPLPTGAPLGSWCFMSGPRGSQRPSLQAVQPSSSSLCAVALCLALMPAGRCFTPSLHAREGVEAIGIRQESRLGCLKSCLVVELLSGGRDACPAWEGVAGVKPSHVSSHMPGIAKSRSLAPQGFWLG